MSPYYQDDFVTLYHGDCMDMMSTLSDVDLVFSSPPYNLGTSTGGGLGQWSMWGMKSLANGYGEHSDAMPQDLYDRWQRDVVRAMWATLGDRGAIFYNHKPRVQAGELILPTIYGEGLPLRQIITWDRGIGMNFSRSFYLPKSEWIMVWAKPSWRLASKEASAIGDVWHIPPEMANEKHPAPFPVALPFRAIASTSAEVVLDPFAGSGSTLRAAKDLGRRAIGIEINEEFCELAARRCAQEVLPL